MHSDLSLAGFKIAIEGSNVFKVNKFNKIRQSNNTKHNFIGGVEIKSMS